MKSQYRLNWVFRNDNKWTKDFDNIGEVFHYFNLLGLKNDPNISSVWIEKVYNELDIQHVYEVEKLI